MQTRKSGYNGAAKGSEGYYLVESTHLGFLASLGIQRVRLKKSRKTPPHWVMPDGKPVDIETNLFVPDPFFAFASRGKSNTEPSRNYAEELSLCVPKEVAERIIILGAP